MNVDFSKKGNSRSFSTSFTPMANPSGNAIGVMVLFHDMTDFLQAQQSEAASRAKSAFLTTMSHEFRTPLNAVIGLSEIELLKDLPGKTRDNLEKIYNSGISLLGLVNDVLDISKIESGSFDLLPNKYSFPRLINDVMQLNAARIGFKELTFDLYVDETIPVSLYGDELRVKRVLNSLLSNAFKYTEIGSVSFKVKWERRGGDAMLVFIVSETGFDAKTKDMEKVLLEYSQLDTRTKYDIEGTGLGLSITKKLVELMKGTITVESESDKGATLTAEIRQQIVDETPIGKDTAEDLMHFRYMRNSGAKGKELVRSYMPYGKVLVVDDVPTNLEVAKGLLLPYGLTIDFADSGKEAIEMIHEEKTRYDIVFMDYMMPEMDGMEATAVIRNEIRTDYARTVPIIALTANSSAGNKEVLLANGFNDYLAKPIDIVQLDAVLNQWVRGKQHEETLWLAEHAGVHGKTKETKPYVIPLALEKLPVNGVDLAAGIERYNNDETVYLGLLRSFVRHTPKLLSNLRSLNENNLSEYAVTVHGIKGSAYGICASEAGSRAEILELAAKTGDFDTVRMGNEAFLVYMEILIANLTGFLGHANELSATDIPKKRLPAPDEALLRKLLEETTRFRTPQMEEVMSRLEQFEYESGGELVAWLREQIDNLEYDAIKERLS
jgi:CheY-like chemotaxis protein/HPt (histidine-containing phosphotransfer) domain-containing protein